jgi:hypothetical protein
LRDSVGQKLSDVEVKSYKAGPKRGRGNKQRVPRPKKQA